MMTLWIRQMTLWIRRMTLWIRRMTLWIRRMTPRIRTMSNLFVGCATAGADFAVPGVASGSGVRGDLVGAAVCGCLGPGWLLAFVVFACCI
jgi:hypothetical protein